VPIVLTAALARPQLCGNPAPADSRPGNQPAVGQVPALHRLVPQAEVGRVGELQVGALLDALTIALSEDMPPARRELVYTTSEVIRELVAA
jgi:hypothetical protein